MAAVAEHESETQLCNNCRKEIPVANFTIHEIHCSRNIGVCPLCKESFPKAEMRAHQEQEHAQIVCKCSMRMDRGLLEDHRAFECPLRPVVCQHCDIELAFCKLQDHEDYCGARTERCGRCNRNVMLRELKMHPIDCGKKAGGGEPGGQAKPPFNPGAPWRNVQTISNVLLPDSTGEPSLRGNRFLERQLHSWVSGDQPPRESGWRNRNPSQPDRSRGYLEKTPPLPGDRESDPNLDYLLALSLQHEHRFGQPSSVSELHRELWKNVSAPQTGPADHWGRAKNSRDPSQDLLVADNNLNRPKTETLLPCEFCEELYPEGDLILHQTGCNPASAVASFSKRSNLVPPTEYLSSLWGELTGHRPVGSSGETFAPRPGLQDSLLLPCEFCGVQLEEEVLFHHQDQCDLRPATAPSSGRRPPAQSGSPVPERSVGSESPELRRRPIRHQGEPSPPYLEQLQQKAPLQFPAPRSYSQVAARRVQLATPNNRREDPAALSKARKAKKVEEGEGRTPGRSPSDPAAVSQPARRPSSDFAPSTYLPSFPLALPTRPSIRQEGGQSPAAPAHFNNGKAKLWQVKSSDADRE
ncbi:TRAF-type zinc finger domain-containing protein 1 [Erythrolamprus reginae]|uniref:TRAF-type zinc finger domain-containing protein 1 n=1 Tax=Erythrolamprus reginae TaxID=121349 RepID=UPI00396C6DF2